MKIYDTLIIGCGYGAIGYASSHEDCIICEEHQVCDTSFYLPMRSFAYKRFEPESDEGKRLLEIFNSLDIFSLGQQNTNAFECAMCKYIFEKRIKVMLKCRVIEHKYSDGIYDVTVQTNEGLTHLYAKKILNTVSRSQSKGYTVLFISKNPERDCPILLGTFQNASIEPAFYKDRYALHIDACDYDENHIKAMVYNVWRELDTDAKILYMSPVFYSNESDEPLFDGRYENPIEAFEAGYFYSAEVEK